jgi:hypothetical protein
MIRVFIVVELEEFDLGITKAWSSILRSPRTDHVYSWHAANTSMHEQAIIHMHKNITTYKGKHYKNMQYGIKIASTVARGKETPKSKLRLKRYYFLKIRIIEYIKLYFYKLILINTSHLCEISFSCNPIYILNRKHILNLASYIYKTLHGSYRRNN